MVLNIVVIEQAEILGERRFQSGITLTNVQRVAVIGNIQQVAHRWLAAIGTIVEAQLADIGYLPTEIGCRSNVRHGANGIGVNTLIVLCKVRALWHHLETNIQVVGLANDAQHNLCRGEPPNKAR